MTNTLDRTNLKNYMLDKGINERFLSVMTGISERSLRSKINGQTQFSTKDVQLITQLFRALFHADSDLLDSLFFSKA